MSDIDDDVNANGREDGVSTSTSSFQYSEPLKSKKNIQSKIISGECILSKVEGRSGVWGSFVKVIYKNEMDTGFVSCTKCKVLLSYTASNGTSHLKRHKCVLVNRSTLSIDNYFEKKLKKNIPTQVANEMVEKCWLDNEESEDNFLSKITWVTDRGSNIIKALDRNNRLNCSGHILHNILQTTFDFPKTSSKDQLINELLSMAVDFSLIEKLISAYKSLVRPLVQHVETRWNSNLAMLRAVHDMYDELIKIYSAENRKMADINKSLLSKLIFLTPFKEASDQFEALFLCPPLKKLRMVENIDERQGIIEKVKIELSKLQSNLISNRSQSEPVPIEETIQSEEDNFFSE
ncbi:hypothetical protein QTP88_014341 [Uroleucon formosanum]